MYKNPDLAAVHDVDTYENMVSYLGYLGIANKVSGEKLGNVKKTT